MEMKLTNPPLYKIAKLLVQFVIIGVVWFVVILALESRRRNNYDNVLASARSQIQPNMTRKSVEDLIPLRPDRTDSVLTQFGKKEELYWDSGWHQGVLHEFIGYTSYKGHFGLTVSFNEDGIVDGVAGGFN
jgi:hypothetical protein